MRNLVETPFSAYLSSVKKHKSLFMVLFIFLSVSEWIGYSSTGLGASSTINEATGAAVTNIFMTYIQWLFVGVVVAIVASKEVKLTTPDFKFTKVKAFSQLLKSMFVWLFGLSLSIMLFLLIFMALGFDGDLEKQEGALLAAFASAAVLMFLSLIYAVSAFQQFIVNDLVKQTISGKKSKSYVNGYLVPFWLLKEICKMWKSLLFLLLMIFMSGLKGWVLVLGYPSLNIMISSIIGLLFVLVMTAGIPNIIKKRVDSFE